MKRLSKLGSGEFNVTNLQFLQSSVRSLCHHGIAQRHAVTLFVFFTAGDTLWPSGFTPHTWYHFGTVSGMDEYGDRSEHLRSVLLMLDDNLHGSVQHRRRGAGD